MSPCVHGNVVCHLRTVHAPYGADELVRHGAYRREVVLHGEVDVAGAHETSLPVVAALLAVLERLDDDILRLKGGAAPCAEVAVYASCREQLLALGVCALVVVIVVKLLVLSGNDIVELRDDGQDLHLQEYGVAPVALEGDVQVPFLVLRDVGPLRLVSEALQVREEPVWHVVALAAHEIDLLIGDDHVLQHLYLFPYELCEAFRVDGVVPVYEHIFYLCAGVVVDDGAAHAELVQVIVGEMSYYLLHLLVVVSWMLLYVQEASCLQSYRLLVVGGLVVLLHLRGDGGVALAVDG